ncbi:MAG: aryl-sulfate sulfotransferase [Candidatus Limnocylindrus sp.]
MIPTSAVTALLVSLLLAVASLATPTTANAAPGLSVRRSTVSSEFAGQIVLRGVPSSLLQYITYTIVPKAGSTAKAITVTYSKAHLVAQRRLGSRVKEATIAIFGLYPGYNNTVRITVKEIYRKAKTITVRMRTAAYVGFFSAATRITVTARNKSVPLAYSYMLVRHVRNGLGPVILDIDGNVRWTGRPGLNSQGAHFWDGSIYLDNGAGYSGGSKLFRMEMTGALTEVADYASEGVWGFHHNYDLGKVGLLIEPNLNVDGAVHVESTIFEIDKAGVILERWNLTQIIRDLMVAGGDDPSAFVRDGDDWLHINASTYWAATDTLVISGRENFVIGIGYTDKQVKWILGDRSKAWATYPSLLARALTMAPGSLAPIGQHSVSITPDGNLMLFDNGFWSFNHDPAGDNRTYSAPRKYSIDLSTMTATEVWNFKHSESIYSPICSSVYQKGSSYLIDYAHATDGRIYLVGLGSSSRIAFKYAWVGNCGDGWNSSIINLEGLRY